MILACIYENIHDGNPELDNFLTFLFIQSLPLLPTGIHKFTFNVICFFCCLNLKLIVLATGSNIGRDNSIRYQDQPQPRSGGSAPSSILQRPACVHCSM